MPEGLPDINLLPQYERHSSTSIYLFFIMLFITFLAFVLIGILYFTTKSKLETINHQLDELQTEQETLLGQIAINEQAGSSSLEAAVQFVEYYTIPTSILIKEIDKLLPKDSYLKSYQYQSQSVSIVTHSEQLSSVAEFTSQLTASDLLVDTKVDEVATFEVKEEVLGERSLLTSSHVLKHILHLTLTSSV